MSRSGSKSQSGSRKSYHHGDLRDALLEAAKEMIAESGVEALTLRAVARHAGVSTAAPYHHFEDKAALVKALAQQSLLDLDKASLEAMAGLSHPRDKLQAIGTAYVLYAAKHPSAFRLMFRPELGSSLDEIELGSAPIYRLLIQIVADLEASNLLRTDKQSFALTAWSLVHGLASLLVDGPLQALVNDVAQVEALAKSATSHLAFALKPDLLEP